MSLSVELSLFGGAIGVTAPSNLVDASNIRQVPDTQEVFLFPNSSVSVIVEVLERVQPQNYEEAIKFHFDSLAYDNSASSQKVDSINIIPNDRGDKTPSVIVLSGLQLVTKYNRTQADEVRIFMALYRVEEKSIDLVVTFNVPLTSLDDGAVDAGGVKTYEHHFDTFVRSLRIVDFDLFA
ncbi:Mog1p/PsbP-like protein [Marasmius fiardii PR-910]|nr:Mog1p/PsbP-like protein [Marasmius fiardii PR-910]